MNALWQWLRSGWRARQREIDRMILWPAICRQTASQEQAVLAFMMHACGDTAWCAEVDGEMTPVEAEEIVRSWPFKKASK